MMTKIMTARVDSASELCCLGFRMKIPSVLVSHRCRCIELFIHPLTVQMSEDTR